MSSSVDDPTLISRAGRALGFSFASTAVGRLSTLAIGIALARILGPAEFGTYAVAMVALIAVLSFNELGVSLAIVRWPGDPREIAPTVATLSLGASTLIYLGCYLGAPAFASAMGDSEAVPVVRLLTLAVVFSGLVATPVAMLQREFKQGRKMIADQVTTWASALTSIGCALTGMGAMSLAVGHITGSIAGAVLFVAFEPRAVRPGFDRQKAAALLKFGLPLAGSSIVVFAVSNIDRLIVGVLLGPVPLGLYVLASNLSNWPISVFSQPVRAVAPAALARLQHDPPAMRRTFLSTTGLLTSVTLPVCVLLAASADPLIHLVYGEAWQAAAAVLPWLGLLAMLRILFELVYDYFVVLADTRVVFTVQVVWLVVLIPAVVAGAHYAGAPGAAAGQFAVALAVVLPLYLRELRRVSVPPAAFGRQLLLPVAAAAVVGAVAWAAAAMIPTDLLALAVAGTASLAAIAALVYRMRTTLRGLRGS
ncbi:lipopolysaccharide biosynthesis protein [Paractinoplanes hotanensis]|uniref:Lipopolysaccharide biosynthesis protein n=1 Tax=Paractinoplanes hotanensis TaxID=2906497 RepID=A0ABT0YHA0_9ACTN|nr:lipopolysaccharide biosynthesis protein [Actinoplanes hotanensis]MCM4084872.1 lipopolysaccharide biosynthesis protein [Actinoplanes hotanensis]